MSDPGRGVRIFKQIKGLDQIRGNPPRHEQIVTRLPSLRAGCLGPKAGKNSRNTFRQVALHGQVVFKNQIVDGRRSVMLPPFPGD
ncbi:hypothetical protein P7L70_23030 [Tistrella mobilis]|uniref:hypothetical protein n=1 Tax=Tistrella mobilis TaxID=171437 RepID=UPI0035591D18